MGELMDKVPIGRGGARPNVRAKSKKAETDPTVTLHPVEQAYADKTSNDARLIKAKADREELKFLQESGEWIPRDAVRNSTATAFSAISQTLRSIPDNIERRFALPPEVLEEIAKIIDESLDGLADNLETMVEKEYEE